MARPLVLYHPGKSFPAFSVTGRSCELRCEHCGGKYLEGMRPLASPEELERAADLLASSGAAGFLLSGGCDRRGRVPLGPYLGAVKRIRARTGLLVNLHTGLLDGAEARAVLDSDADALSVDVLQDSRAIAGALHAEASPGDYARTLELLSPSGRLVPHVCVGLQSEAGEERTLDLLATVDMRALIVLGLVPPKGSPPTDARRVVRFISRAVERLDAPVILGCMRPRGGKELEAGAIDAGAAGVVNPSAGAVAYAEGLGLRIERKGACCALHL